MGVEYLTCGIKRYLTWLAIVVVEIYVLSDHILGVDIISKAGWIKVIGLRTKQWSWCENSMPTRMPSPYLFCSSPGMCTYPRWSIPIFFACLLVSGIIPTLERVSHVVSGIKWLTLKKTKGSRAHVR